ncbi:uncharacterized protein LOC113799102 isoform X1 [Dermatophagoides pteronyssinus]|uniref:uncharacterized protein LOC113799102 isoform X1 n=1 Tax=Dermatophagoides pteronyssinus TaxID=6956 RepID=UPI003F6651E5
MSTQSKFGNLNSDKQILYLVQWFTEFSEFQRNDFLNDYLMKIYQNFFDKNLFDQNHQDNSNGGNAEENASTLVEQQEEETNGKMIDDIDDGQLADDLNESLKLTKNKPPSIFECRMKLFSEWYEKQWNDNDRIELLLRLKNIDSEFIWKFYRKLLSEQNLLDRMKFQLLIDSDGRKNLIERLDMMNVDIFQSNNNDQANLTINNGNGNLETKQQPDLLANCHSNQSQQQQSNDEKCSNNDPNQQQQQEDNLISNEQPTVIVDVVDKTPDLLA